MRAARQIEETDIDRLAANALQAVATERAKPDLLKTGIPGEPTLWRIVVEPVTPNEKVGSLYKADATVDAEKYMTNVGRVLAVGPEALVGKTESGCDLSHVTDSIRKREDLIGKYVVYQKHSGTRMKLRDGGIDLVILTITEIDMITDDPEAWVFYL